VQVALLRAREFDIDPREFRQNLETLRKLARR
jgi:hypothetical protein